MATKVPVQDFLKIDGVLKCVKRAHKLKGTQFSDVVDEEGNQYVDLVQEGGGTLGIALVGYLYILEQAGLRVYSMAGTSAGAITTLMMAAYQEQGATAAEKLLKLVSEQDLFELVDGRHKKLINAIIKGKKLNLFFLSIVGAPFVLYDLLVRKGLNPGRYFLEWIKREMSAVGVNSVKDLESRQKAIKDHVSYRNGGSVTSAPRLAIITSDVTTHSKIQLPEMAELFWKNQESYHPAEMARVSMSIPFFFYPYEVKDIPNAGNSEDPHWDKHARYFGEVPKSVKFVDGGMLSNFPINVFHLESGVPSRPTFGARLSTYREAYSDTGKFWKFLGGMISTMRQIHDYDFILRNPDYRQLICNIDADAQYNWLNFNLSAEEQKGLFTLGAKKAIEFLEKFNWEEYKKGRN